MSLSIHEYNKHACMQSTYEVTRNSTLSSIVIELLNIIKVIGNNSNNESITTWIEKENIIRNSELNLISINQEYKTKEMLFLNPKEVNLRAQCDTERLQHQQNLNLPAQISMDTSVHAINTLKEIYTNIYNKQQINDEISISINDNNTILNNNIKTEISENNLVIYRKIKEYIVIVLLLFIIIMFIFIVSI
jgi:hypothetical protein